jgi:hypothetical protein
VNGEKLGITFDPVIPFAISPKVSNVDVGFLKVEGQRGEI